VSCSHGFVMTLMYVVTGGLLSNKIYKVVQIRRGLFVCKQVTVCPGHI
jgi:hypothetical protein